MNETTVNLDTMSNEVIESGLRETRLSDMAEGACGPANNSLETDKADMRFDGFRADEFHGMEPVPLQMIRMIASALQGGRMPTSSPHNMRTILENDPNLQNLFCYNSLTETVELRCNYWGRTIADKRRIRPGAVVDSSLKDRDLEEIAMYINQTYELYNIDALKLAINTVAYKTTYDPIVDKIENTPWDGTRRADNMIAKYFGTANGIDYVTEVSHKWLLGALMRVMEPGCKVDTALVLKGEQGIGKSTFLRMLSLGYFDDCIDSLTSRDDKIKLRKAWIIEFGEGVATGAATTAKVKQYLSAQEDSYRSPYGHVSESHQRHCAFAITTNDDAFLKDTTGSRRFMIIDAEATASKPWNMTSEEVLQVWAEVKTWYDQGDRNVVLSEYARKQASEVAEMHREQDPYEDAIVSYLSMYVPENWDEMSKSERIAYKMRYESGMSSGNFEITKATTSQLWNEALREVGTPSRKDAIRIGKIVCDLMKWKKTKNVTISGYTPNSRGFTRQ